MNAERAMGLMVRVLLAFMLAVVLIFTACVAEELMDGAALLDWIGWMAVLGLLWSVFIFLVLFVKWEED